MKRENNTQPGTKMFLGLRGEGERKNHFHLMSSGSPRCCWSQRPKRSCKKQGNSGNEHWIYWRINCIYYFPRRGMPLQYDADA